MHVARVLDTRNIQYSSNTASDLITKIRFEEYTTVRDVLADAELLSVFPILPDKIDWP